ncbi:MAG: diguanylate cyclase [Arcobacteraceae bacterium]|nr:diguanylate cyclase [Arcobacteraceae bacterium]
MKQVVQLKEFSYILRINKVKIVDFWLEMEDVKNILGTHQIIVSDDRKKVFYELFDCIVGVVQWDLTISDCPIKNKFLQILSESSVNTAEIFTLFISLKNSVESYFYKEGLLSFGLSSDIEKIFLKVTNELYNTYEEMKDSVTDFKNEHSNLLNEYKKAVDLSNIVSKTNPKGIITYVNNKFCEISGYSRSELIGKPHNIVRHPTMQSSVFKELWDTIKEKKPWRGVVVNMKKDGRKYVVDSTIVPILDIDGDVVEYIAIRHDVTEFEQTKEQLSTLNRAMKHKVDELYSMTQVLEEQASIDVLTSTFNRAKFEEFFDLEFQKAKMQRNHLSIILLDIDRFKSINDTFGHDVGDSILKEIAKMIAKNIRSSDTLARWGGEEFAILLPGTQLDKAKVVATNLQQSILEHKFESVDTQITASFGVALCTESDNKEDFFKRADKALYKAKNSGRNLVVGEDEL